MTAKKEFTVVKRWTAAEEAALKAGIRKYGAGAWVRIRDDKEFGHFLERRTGMQLKDKWRNLLKFGHITEAEGRRPAGAAPCGACGCVALPGADGKCGACGVHLGNSSAATAASTPELVGAAHGTQRHSAGGGGASGGVSKRGKARRAGTRAAASRGAPLAATSASAGQAFAVPTFVAGARLMVEDSVHSNVWWQGMVVRQAGADVWITFPGWSDGVAERVDASSARLWSGAITTGAGGKKAWRHLGGGAWSVRSRERGERRPPAEALAGPTPPVLSTSNKAPRAKLGALGARSVTPDSAELSAAATAAAALTEGPQPRAPRSRRGARRDPLAEWFSHHRELLRSDFDAAAPPRAQVPFGTRCSGSAGNSVSLGATSEGTQVDWARSEADTSEMVARMEAYETPAEVSESFDEFADLLKAADGSAEAAARGVGCAPAALASPAQREPEHRLPRLAGVLPPPPLEVCGPDAWAEPVAV